MIKIKNVALGILFFFLLIGCQKDSDGSDPVVNSTNHFRVGNVEYPLSQGKLTFHRNYNAFTIALFSSSIIMGGDGNLNGGGYYISLSGFNSNNSELDEGRYIFDLSGAQKIHTLDYGAYNLGAEDIQDDEYYVYITKGEIVFKSIGNGVYEVKIDCSTATDVQVTGYYKGVLHKFHQ